jgi:two-component system phosphate regulon sensor histidine kinase PhoR
VVLVVATVAVPSLLLTGLGTVAVSNEAAATKTRLEKEYKPVMDKAAKAYNSLMDKIFEEAQPQLEQLARWAQTDGDDDEDLKRRLADKIARTQIIHAGQGQLEVELRGDEDEDRLSLPPDLAKSAAGPFLVNPFVIDADGQLLLPKRPDWGEPPSSAVPQLLRDAQVFEQAHQGQKDPCEQWRRLVSDSCLARLSLLACEGGALSADARARLGPDCQAFADDPVVGPYLQVRALAAERARVPEPFLTAVEKLVALLASPALSSSAWLVELAARDTAERLGTLEKNDGADLLRQKLVAVAERSRLLAVLLEMTRSREAAATSIAIPVDGWHRVLVTRSMDGTLAGFELVAAAMSLPTTQAISGLDLPVPTRAVIWPLSSPPSFSDEHKRAEEHGEERVLSFALLKKSQLAWELVLMRLDDESLFSLSRSRTSLYLWALLLIAAALFAGIGYTVTSVVREARQSRLKVDFVSSVSHDLRTPLTSIRMFTETLLLGRVRDKAEEKECLSVIAQETERLSRLTQRILDFSRMEAGRKAYTLKPVEVAPMVQQALDACRPQLQAEGFEVQLDLSPKTGLVVADRDAIIEALINLITNATKYSPEQKYLKVSSCRVGKVVEVAVEDHGMGIPRSEQAKIFEKFYRVDCRRTSEVSGSGIGLSLVEHIVKGHQGEVEVKSEPGRGSTFTLRLPAA